MKPTVGRIVEFVMPDGQIRPAIIVRVWNDTCVQLQVFTDGSNDGNEFASGVFWATSVVHSPVKLPRTWDWMEYQKGQAAKTEVLEAQLNAQATATDHRSISEQIARLCHEVNRAYCRSIGDDSQPSWEDAPQWQKDSAINGVEFHLNNETTPEQSHENWMKEKVAAGWVFGPVKDPEKKEHPCMVAYDQLPLEQRTKDYLFKAIVDTCK